MIGELARQRIMMGALGCCVFAVAMGGGLERALFVPSSIVAALQANPRIAALEAQPEASPATRVERRQRRTQALPIASAGLPAQPDETPATPIAEPEAAGPAQPSTSGTQFAYTEPQSPPPAGSAPNQGRILAFAIPSGPDIYGNTPVEPLPEPETWAMMLAGLLVAGGATRYRRRQGARLE